MRSTAMLAVILIMILGSALVTRAAPPITQVATPAVGSVGVGGGEVGSGESRVASGYLLSLRRGSSTRGASCRCTITRGRS